MSSRSRHEATQTSSLTATVPRIAAKRRVRRAREKRAIPISLPPVVARPMVPEVIAPDPVRIAVLAIEGLGRASMRAAFSGIEVRVAVPDEAIAAVFRAALAETGRTRMTDRLIRVVVV